MMAAMMNDPVHADCRETIAKLATQVGKMTVQLDMAKWENRWRPMSEHIFPWRHERMIVVAVSSLPLAATEIYRVRCGEHGALFADDMTLSLIEMGWLPYAWRPDDTPALDTEGFEPLREDYLTKGQ